ncbi:DEAD/DEAH box helicase [Desertimonas flava]|uniref:DEAD/DEAH box helicase n=1 Tax=Desertimonas flava TaxID=2064846 RepID=UPI000E355139|nr:DEAD/DEAH box helicase [Desertimonas flava]
MSAEPTPPDFSYPFTLDRFQVEAITAFDAGRHVVVAAPTGSGKTVVAEHGIETARRRGRRAFYTAPLKALSNQKYADLSARYDPHPDSPRTVGLLTGDNSIDGDAATVVMTTEVLRNMIYSRSRALDSLGLVVLDEVHFLQDAYRGPVWEEVIIHLPDHVQLVCLSATVSNTAELAAWIETVRGPTTAVVETRRPVRLDDYYLVGDRTSDRLHFLPTFVNGSPNTDAMKLDASAVRGRYGRQPGRGRPRAARGSGQRVLFTPSRMETLDLLDQRDLLPAIFFIFSRNQCSEAARSVAAAGVRLTTGPEREEIRSIVDTRLEGLDDGDLAVLGYAELLAQLEAGIAPHHAGMVPAFKEVVEQCFIAGLLKAVFATETLAVGVNMPARTVVIEKLTKFTGDHHEMLTPGEYTQLTGRAGRRGIDAVGQAVVLWSPFVSFDRVAELAGSRQFHLRSAFRPTYNMAANLVRAYSPEEARHLLNLSFAQYQADRDVVRLEARTERLRQRLADARAAAESPHGDIWEYRAQREADEAPRAVADRDVALMKLRPGDVVHIHRGRYHGPAVMVASARRKGGMRLTMITDDAEAVIVGAPEVADPVQVVGRVRVPGEYQPKSRDYRRDIARRLRKATLAEPPGRRRGRRGDDAGYGGVHPVELDPDLRERMRTAGQAVRFERELAEISTRIDGHNRSLGREFERVLDVLVHRDCVERDDAVTWSLTAKGVTLTRVFHECDLLIVEALAGGHLDGVDAPTLAGLLSTFVYEHRSPEPPPPPWFPSGEVRSRWRRLAGLSDDLAAEEEALGLSVHRRPDPGFFAAAHGWVAGHDLDTVIGDVAETSGGLAAGDFVRTMKQLVDLARQVAEVAPDPSTRDRAATVALEAFRGVVADGTIVAPADAS